MNPLAQILDDEAFDRQLACDRAMTPEHKAARLRQVDKMAALPQRACLLPGESFDILEPADDLPIIPPWGNILPSERAMRRRPV